ncbi:MAG TPA: AbrB/MazE/SpoVT family DNA-binding domain-containing protein [Baekduia sp.]|nr:AbrB/MazE/SpoVT family DNA-binding domain-containing protein [Baekduia sp.]
MRAAIDRSGRLTVPKALRDELGFDAGVELELSVVNGRLEVSALSRVVAEQGPHGVRFVAAVSDRATTEQVRALIERGRR